MARKHYKSYEPEEMVIPEVQPQKHMLNEKQKKNAEEINSTVSSPAEEESTVPGTVYGMVTGASLVRLRKEPSFEADVVKLIPRGTEVMIEGEKNEFKEVSVLGEHGFISSKFLEIFNRR